MIHNSCTVDTYSTLIIKSDIIMCSARGPLLPLHPSGAKLKRAVTKRLIKHSKSNSFDCLFSRLASYRGHCSPVVREGQLAWGSHEQSPRGRRPLAVESQWAVGYTHLTLPGSPQYLTDTSRKSEWCTRAWSFAVAWLSAHVFITSNMGSVETQSIMIRVMTHASKNSNCSQRAESSRLILS